MTEEKRVTALVEMQAKDYGSLAIYKIIAVGWKDRWVFGNVTEVIPNSPFGKVQDICDYNKCFFDPGALESNLIVVFNTQDMMKPVWVSLEQETHRSGAEFRATMRQGNLLQHIVT